MDEQKRLRKKRPAAAATTDAQNVASSSTDLNKKRKLTDQSSKEVTKTAEEAPKQQGKNEAKPWENAEEKEVDYRWDICENCQ